jgi:hypothetical protein
MSKAQEKAEYRNEAIHKLRKMLPLGSSKVKVTIQKTSASNMTWYARVYVAQKNEVVNITVYAARAIDWPLKEIDGEWCIKGGGVGTCRAFEIGHHLSYALHGFYSPDKTPALRIPKKETAVRAYGKNLREVRGTLEKLRSEKGYDDPEVRKAESVCHAYHAGYTIKGEWL